MFMTAQRRAPPAHIHVRWYEWQDCGTNGRDRTGREVDA